MPVYKHDNNYRRYFPIWYAKLCDGAHHDGRDRYPITWNVKLNSAPTWPEVWQQMVKENYTCENEAILDLGSMAALRARYDASAAGLYEYAVEGMQRSVTDDDTFRTCRPEVFKRWGVTGQPQYHVKYGFVGRSGGWLVMEEFGHQKLVGGSIEHDVHWWHPDLVRGLLCLMDEIHLSVPKRNEELCYQMAWGFYNNVLRADE
jgi:hypothetical protein